MADRETRKKKTAARRQEQILKAAGEVFTRRGYAAATVPEIAALAGVAVGTIYNYYPSKRELFIAVIRDFVLTVPLLNLLEKMPGPDMAATFRQVFQNRLHLIEDNQMARISSLMGEIQRDPELKALWVEQSLQPFLSRMEGLYHNMTASGRIRRMEPAVAVRAVGGLILGFLMLKLVEGESSPLNRLPQDEVAEELMNFVLHGLTADTADKKSQKEDAL